MADNGNRGSNDSLRRGGRRRREPPIIDAAATEVPLDPVETADDAPLTTRDTAPETTTPAASGELPTALDAASVADAPPSEPAAAEPAAAEHEIASTATGSDEPVLFGNALRDPPHREAPTAESTSEFGDETAALDPASPEAEAKSPDPVSSDPVPLTAAEQPSFSAASSAGAAATQPASPTRSNPLAGILGIAAVLLLGIIGWLLYSGGSRGDVASTVADLKARVATLEARPDPAALQTQIAALDKRVSAVEADRTSIGKQVAALSSRVDGLTAPASPGASAPATGAGGSDAKPAEGPPGQPAVGPAAAATVAAVAALAAKIDGIDGRVSALADQQAGIEKTVASLPKPVAPDFGPVNAKVAALETQINDTDAKINGSDARLNGFDAKINGVDAKVNGFDTKMNGLDVRLNGLEAKLDDETAQGAKLQSALANLPKVDLGPLQTATAALDARVAKVEGQFAAPKDGARVTEARAVGSADEARATPVAVVGQAIQRAIAAGKPYGPEIDALKALGADPALVARLGPASAGGAPSVDALKTQWNDARGQVLATVKPVLPAAGGALNRLLGSATSIVQVHRTGEVSGDDTNALVSQIDAALDAGDVGQALAAWNKLPDPAKAASSGWADAARSRVDAVGAAQDLVGGAIATLGRTRS